MIEKPNPTKFKNYFMLVKLVFGYCLLVKNQKLIVKNIVVK